jgi:SAM-dependent methyltransferase
VSVNGSGLSEAGLWQLVESDGYRVDLDIWAGLAAGSDGRVLDLGCGVGRVSHHLNRLGHSTTGVDRDPELVADFNRTRPEGSPSALTLDVTGLLVSDSPLRDMSFGLIIAPQQLLQIIGGREARARMLAAVRNLSMPGALTAFAICQELPDAPVDYPDVPPDLREVNGWVHSSQPVSIETTPDTVTAFRDRKSLSPEGDVHASVDSVTLDRLDLSGLEAELVEAGIEPVGSSVIPGTDRHMASTLVLARPFTS